MGSTPNCLASTSAQAHLLPLDELHRSPHGIPSAPSTHPAVKSELTTSPSHRLRSLSPLLLPNLSPRAQAKAAILPIHIRNNQLSSGSRHAVFSVNSQTFLTSPATPADAFNNYLGPSPSTPSSSAPHVLTNRRQRLWTSNLVIQPSSHGNMTSTTTIPKNLPPAPPTQPCRSSESAPDPVTDYESLKANYLNMIRQNPSADTAAGAVQEAPADLIYQDLSEILRQVPPTPDLTTSPEFDDFLTTSPELDLLNTPVIPEDDMLPPDFYDENQMLFSFIDDNMWASPDPVEKSLPPPPLPQKMLMMTPESPMLPDFDQVINPASPALSPSPPMSSLTLTPATPAMTSFAPTLAFPAATAPSKRKNHATGTRKGLTTALLVPIDAPTQPRRYLAPSVTSRKDLPVLIAKKRARSEAFGDDDVEPLGPNPSERELIEYKRRQNTVAARRSRKRKLEYQQLLEDNVESLRSEVVQWRERTGMLAEMVRGLGGCVPNWEDE